MSYLMDTNVLISVLDSRHVHHLPVSEWFEGLSGLATATCPTVENGAIRYLVRTGINAPDALDALLELKQDGRVAFVPESDSMATTSLTGVTGHRQITDVYLCQIATSTDRKLATFDQGLCNLRPLATANLALLET